VPADGRGCNLGGGAVGEDDISGNSTLPTPSSSPTKTVPDDANAAFARAQDTFNTYRLRGDIHTAAYLEPFATQKNDRRTVT
jgi:hypothetical protein